MVPGTRCGTRRCLDVDPAALRSTSAATPPVPNARHPRTILDHLPNEDPSTGNSAVTAFRYSFYPKVGEGMAAIGHRFIDSGDTA